LYNSSPLGTIPQADPDEFAPKSKAFMSDHAADQACFGSLWEDYRSDCDRQLRGKEAILSVSPMALLEIIAEACDEKITAAGGLEQWNSLSEEVQDEKDAEAYAQIIMHLGEDAYDTLSAEDQCAVGLFIHAGCCMHKELNTCKGGNTCMMAWWAKEKATGPVKLMNRDNAAAAASGSSTAKKRAADISGAGGVKATSLAGPILNNKDSKKGQQDTLQAFLVLEIRYTISFPDTHNIRYHSHCNAATELIVNLPLYLKFLEMVHDKK
jgi:hypothetical protein